MLYNLFCSKCNQLDYITLSVISEFINVPKHNFVHFIILKNIDISTDVIKLGLQGQDVDRIQIALKKAGLSPGTIVSVLGLKIAQVVRYFK